MPHKNQSQASSFPLSRCALIGGALAYTAAFHWAYASWVAPVYAFAGANYLPPSQTVLLILYILAVLPSIWIPLEIRRPTQFVYVVIYITVYVPSVLVPTFIAYQTVDDTLLLSFTLCMGYGLIGATYRFPTVRLRHSAISADVFWSLVYGLVLTFDAWIFITFRGSLQFVSFEDVYSVRHSATEVLQSAGLLSYAMCWLSGALNPYLMVSGIFERKKTRILLGVAGQILIYAAAAHKAALVSILFVPAFAVWFRGGPRRFPLKLVALVLVIVLAIAFGMQIFPSSQAVHWTGVVVLFRTFALPGMLTAQYQDFFSRNPRTWFSQYAPLQTLLQSPYTHEVSYEVGEYYTGDQDVQSNAHFWASDGIASTGVGGILIASVLCGLVFWVTDNTLTKCSEGFGAAALTFWALAISNASLLTSISSLGLGILILLFYFGPPITQAHNRCRSLRWTPQRQPQSIEIAVCVK